MNGGDSPPQTGSVCRGSGSRPPRVGGARGHSFREAHLTCAHVLKIFKSRKGPVTLQGTRLDTEPQCSIFPGTGMRRDWASWPLRSPGLLQPSEHSGFLTPPRPNQSAPTFLHVAHRKVAQRAGFTARQPGSKPRSGLYVTAGKCLSLPTHKMG